MGASDKHAYYTEPQYMYVYTHLAEHVALHGVRRKPDGLPRHAGHPVMYAHHREVLSERAASSPGRRGASGTLCIRGCNAEYLKLQP